MQSLHWLPVPPAHRELSLFALRCSVCQISNTFCSHLYGHSCIRDFRCCKKMPISSRTREPVTSRLRCLKPGCRCPATLVTITSTALCTRGWLRQSRARAFAKSVALTLVCHPSICSYSACATLPHKHHSRRRDVSVSRNLQSLTT